MFLFIYNHVLHGGSCRTKSDPAVDSIFPTSGDQIYILEWSILSSEYKKSGIQWSTLGVRVFKEKSIWEQEKNLKTTLEKKSENWKITFISRLIYEFNAYEKIEIKTLFIYLELVIDRKKWGITNYM